MVKLFKFYILLACTTLCLFGCGKDETVPETEKEPVQEVQEEQDTEETTSAAEEEIYHPVKDGVIDYLSVEGISLQAGTEIAMVATTSENSYWDVVKSGAQKAIADLNQKIGFTGKDKISFTFTAPKSENVIDQINIIDQFLDKAPDALCIAFADASACKTQMQMAKNNGIKLIAFDTSDDNLMTEALVGTDNHKAAAEASEKLFEEIGYQGKIAIIVHNSLTKTGQDRKQAIVDTLANSYNDKDMQFVDIVYLAQDDRSEKEILDELLERTPDLAGIICTDLVTTEMVIDYSKKLEERNFAIVGFDNSEKIINAVEDGTIIGTMSQDPYGIGYATVVTAARTIAELPKASKVYSEHQWIDSENLHTEEIQSLLNF